jgi:FSR family fosmidomycin resistance protein-like MFS transporter
MLLSHFFQLVLAPLIPWLQAPSSAGAIAELGFVLSVLFAVSGIRARRPPASRSTATGRAPPCAADSPASRIGAATVRRISHGYCGLSWLGAVFAGLGNSRLPSGRFLVHQPPRERAAPGPGLSPPTASPAASGGHFAPVFLVGLAGPARLARGALLAAALLPVAGDRAGVALYREVLDAPATAAPRATHTAHCAGQHGRRRVALRLPASLPAIWLCFGFFFFVAAALGGVQSFSRRRCSCRATASRAARRRHEHHRLHAGQRRPACWRAAGSWRAASALERNITIALALVGAGGPGWWRMQLAARARWPCSRSWRSWASAPGLSGPSRDMLIRGAAPPGATGRVYGVVYSGLDAGIAARAASCSARCSTTASPTRCSTAWRLCLVGAAC